MPDTGARESPSFHQGISNAPIPQHPDGYWNPSPGIALSLLAQKITPSDVAHLEFVGRKGWKSALVIQATDGNYTEANASLRGEAGNEARAL